MTALMALMMVIMRRYPERPMTLAVGPVSCLQLVATVWIMGAQLDVTARELVLLAGFGVVHAAAAVLPGVLYTPKGVWLSASPTGQTVNALLDADIRTDIEDGACCNEAFCDVARAG